MAGFLTRVHDEAGLHAFHDVVAAGMAADFVALPADPFDSLLPALSGWLNGEWIELWVADAAGEPAVAATIGGSAHDNLDLANVALSVHPDHRRRGYGRSAADELLARVRELGRTRVHVEVPTHTRHADPAPGVAMAKGYAAAPLLVEWRRLLDVRAVDPSYLAELEAGARAAAAGYATLSWQDRTPPELVDDMASLTALMSTDPPLGDLELEPEAWDAERYLERERSVIERGRRHLTVAARDERTGRLVGYTDLATPSDDDPLAHQWGTVVAAEHRGHRLGLLMKAVNLRALMTHLPNVRYLNTWNADANTHMVAVNDALGFERIEGWTQWGLSLS